MVLFYSPTKVTVLGYRPMFSRVSSFQFLWILFLDLELSGKGGRPVARPQLIHYNTNNYETQLCVHDPSGIKTHDSSIQAAQNSTGHRPRGLWQEVFFCFLEGKNRLLACYLDGIRLIKHKRKHDFNSSMWRDEIESFFLCARSPQLGTKLTEPLHHHNTNFSARHPNLHVTAENLWKLTEDRECSNSMLVNKWPFTTNNKLSMRSIFPSCV